ncbi:MAG: glycosyltransferase [Tabrizicola sp.]|nr:glycosyltransferase [Tabrizicola sp.]
MTIRAIKRQEGRPPSILSINAYHYPRGGADVVYLNHARLMEEHGWLNKFFSMHHAENLPSDESIYFAEEIDYAKRTSAIRKAVDATRIIYSLEARQKISALLDAHPIDIAHVHSIYHHQSPSVLDELRARGVPIVLTAHDLKLACPAYTMLSQDGVCERCKGGRVWNVAVHRCIKGSLAASTLIMVESAVHKALRLYDRNLDRVITPSAFYKEKLIEWGWNPDKIVHIRNFVAPPLALPAPKAGEGIVYFGRLSREKGLATLVRASSASGVPVRIVGRGPQEAELRSLADTLAAPVEFLGFQQGDALWSVVDAARAIVLPSEWYENGPMSVIEAFGRGKPLIGARIGGIPEMIDEGRTGWAFASGDVNDLAEVMIRVSTLAPDRLLDMAEHCRTFAVTHHSENTYFDQISAVYDGLMARRS